MEVVSFVSDCFPKRLVFKNDVRIDVVGWQLPRSLMSHSIAGMQSDNPVLLLPHLLPIATSRPRLSQYPSLAGRFEMEMYLLQHVLASCCLDCLYETHQ